MEGQSDQASSLAEPFVGQAARRLPLWCRRVAGSLFCLGSVSVLLHRSTWHVPGDAAGLALYSRASMLPGGTKLSPSRSYSSGSLSKGMQPIPNTMIRAPRDSSSQYASYWPKAELGHHTLKHVAMAHPGTEASPAKAATSKKKSFVEEMKRVAMKLHTKDQAPKGGKEAPKERPKFAPTREAYLSFLVESKLVYNTLEDIMAAASHPSYVAFQNTGLERSAALERDIAALSKEYGLEVPVPADDGPGRTYSAILTQLGADDPPAFMCHYYNTYFAHTAGGRMIGKMVSDNLLDGKKLDFYEYDGNMGELLENVRKSINAGADEWSREQKDHCLEETEKSFKYGGALLKCMMPGGSGH
eukprot:gnl/TRDRNA2_/TRDRNA2_183593_c0_seq1.p1 gnl/TRDRNA2_/TRDRNA2_183593_c0~~gnl/TRDRNA2_/TRDRNA2_183593_c0_seq1.p1  ORF type:complete len:358 (+),score=61.13 gnl/TRDRNA2_/TRDRNA2_183593_c0_seq1:55-1128(+)